jgi:SagB-type dehydrogenase family enzyme
MKLSILGLNAGTTEQNLAKLLQSFKFIFPRMRKLLCLLILNFSGMITYSQSNSEIRLPAPQTTGGKPLMEALKERKSDRNFSEKDLDNQTLSNLLWAAYGFNRADEKKRTAPSAMNKQEIDIYVATKQGLYRYNAFANILECVSSGDLRKYTGVQPFVAVAPVNLVYVADYAQMGGGNDEDKLAYAYADAGFIGQNVYLFCASEGLITVVRGSINKTELAKYLKLRSSQKIILAQTVGYKAQ